jgi:hypothetical protein
MSKETIDDIGKTLSDAINTIPIIEEVDLQELNKTQSESSSIDTNELGEGSGLTIEEKIEIQKQDMIETVETIQYIQPMNLEQKDRQTLQVPESNKTDKGLAIILGTQAQYSTRARTEPEGLLMKWQSQETQYEQDNSNSEETNKISFAQRIKNLK